jgi:ethanolamine utilization protein EutA (predicted chaperonin)
VFKRKSDITALGEHEMMLGDKRVKIEKLTIVKWRELFEVVDKLPGLIVQVLTASSDDFYAYVVTALDLAADEVSQIVSVLSGVEAEYLQETVGVDELIEYLARTVKRNRLDGVVKNVQSLLPKAKKEE